MLVQVVDLLLANGCLDGDRRQRVGLPRGDLAGELGRGDAQDPREAADDLAPASFDPGHVADPELHRGPGDVRDDDAPVAIENRPPWRLDAYEAQLVVLGRLQVVLAREHLQRPEPEEEDAEHEQRERTEDADSQRERRSEAVWLPCVRVRREEAIRLRPPFAMGAIRQRAPPPRTTRSPAGPRRPLARARRSEARARGSARVWAGAQ